MSGQLFLYNQSLCKNGIQPNLSLGWKFIIFTASLSKSETLWLWAKGRLSRMSYYRYITGVYKSYWPELNRTLRSSSVPRTVAASYMFHHQPIIIPVSQQKPPTADYQLKKPSYIFLCSSPYTTDCVFGEPRCRPMLTTQTPTLHMLPGGREGWIW